MMCSRKKKQTTRETSEVVWIGNQAFADYRLWECYKAGMYGNHLREPMVVHAASLLGCPESFRAALELAIEAWPISARVNLTDPFKNRWAWCGRAACCHKHGANLEEVNAGWRRLSHDSRDRADAVAFKIIRRMNEQWKLDLYHIRSGQLVFQF